MSTETCACVICPPRDNPAHCSICLTPHCAGFEAGKTPRTVCWSCISTVEAQVRLVIAAESDINEKAPRLARIREVTRTFFGKVFPDGLDSDGKWIDPASKLPTRTCSVCFAPSCDFQCGALMLAMGGRCRLTKLTVAEAKACDA